MPWLNRLQTFSNMFRVNAWGWAGSPVALLICFHPWLYRFGPHFPFNKKLLIFSLITELLTTAAQIGGPKIPRVSASKLSQSFNEFITCFHESWIYKKKYPFFWGMQSVFFCYNKQFYWHFYLHRKLLPYRKTKQRKFRDFFCKFRNRENMWWAWPLNFGLSGMMKSSSK